MLCHRGLLLSMVFYGLKPMTKPQAPVFAPYWERPAQAAAIYAPRILLASAALVLAACSSTPLPEWPATPSGNASSPMSSGAESSPSMAPSQPTVSATPVSSSHHVQALPYSAAIAQLFPDPSARYNTPGLAPDRRSFTTNSELADAVQALHQNNAGAAPRIGVLQSGNAQSGAPIYAVIATQAGDITPLALEETKRPTVMIVAAQQGTDSAATEAALVIAKELGAGGLLAPLLATINVVLVPRANPDGFELGTAATADGTDLRFDHLQLKTPEARFLAKLARDYRPSVLLDAGEFAAIEPTLSRFGAVRANDVGLQYATTPNAHEFVIKAAREWMHEPTAKALSQIDQRVDWAFAPAGSNTENGFAMGTVDPTTLRNASGLKNIVSMEVHSRGSDLGHTHAQRRVHSHVQAMTAVLQNASQRAADLRKVHTFVTRDVASRACRSTMTVQAQPRTEQRAITLIDAHSAELVQKTTAWQSGLHVPHTRTRGTPCGYWLSANAVQATERLEMLGVMVQRVAELSSLEAETYQAAIVAGGNVQLQRSNLEAPPGSYYVSMNQPLAFLAAAALEPDTPYSFYTQGALSNLKEAARVVTLPQIVFDEE